MIGRQLSPQHSNSHALANLIHDLSRKNNSVTDLKSTKDNFTNIDPAHSQIGGDGLSMDVPLDPPIIGEVSNETFDDLLDGYL